jgi:hypothetical protein
MVMASAAMTAISPATRTKSAEAEVVITSRTSTVAADADGLTMLVPNAIVRAEPTTPRARPRVSPVSVPMA